MFLQDGSVMARTTVGIIQTREDAVSFVLKFIFVLTAPLD